MRIVAVFLLGIGDFFWSVNTVRCTLGKELVMETPVVAKAGLTDAEVEKRLKNYWSNATVTKRSARSS